MLAQKIALETSEYATLARWRTNYIRFLEVGDGMSLGRSDGAAPRRAGPRTKRSPTRPPNAGMTLRLTVCANV
jgi:hypothetical protein